MKICFISEAKSIHSQRWTDGLAQNGCVLHLISSTVAEFAEACFFEEKMNDLNTGSWDGLLDVMVVLCRKRPSEELYAYNENRHKLRRKLFKQLKMDVVINVSFFLLKLNTLLSNNLVIYGMAQAIAQKEQQQLQTNTDGN